MPHRALTGGWAKHPRPKLCTAYVLLSVHYDALRGHGSLPQRPSRDCQAQLDQRAQFGAAARGLDRAVDPVKQGSCYARMQACTRARAHTPRATRTHAQHAHLVRRWRICNSCMSLALCRCCKSWCAHSATVNSIISAEVPPPSKQACVRMFGGVWARVGLAAVVLEMQPPVPACNATRAVRTQRSMCRAVSA